MANEEHLALLKQGIEAWNKWRDENPEIRPNLNNADLNEADLKNADLRNADLRNTNLVEANLYGADMRWATLTDASLINANLIAVKLNGASLLRTNFQLAKLIKVDFFTAHISQTNFHLARLDGANLAGANLIGDVPGQGLDVLWKVNIRQATFDKTNLSQANLSGQNISEQNFRETNLNGANLSRIEALGTDFRDSVFTGTCIEDWNINNQTNLNGVICDYVYQKAHYQEGKLVFTERRPRNGNFAPGEFTALFQKAIETVDLIFIDGIDWQAFLQSFQELKKQYGEKISIQAIEKKSGDAFIIRLEVAPEIDKVALEKQHEELYIKLSLMQEKITFKDEQLIYYREQLADERQKNSNFTPIINTLAENQRKSLEVIKTMANKNSRTIHTGGGNYIESNSGTYVEGSFINMSQDLAQAASQIQDLIEQLQKQGVTVNVAQEQVANEMATEAKKDPEMMNKLINWVQSLANTTVSDVVKGSVKLAIRSAGIPLP